MPDGYRAASSTDAQHAGEAINSHPGPPHASVLPPPRILILSPSKEELQDGQLWILILRRAQDEDMWAAHVQSIARIFLLHSLQHLLYGLRNPALAMVLGAM
jgi:hypothetical protein